MLRVVFMGTPEFAVPALESVHSNFQVVGVYTQPDKPVGRGQEFRHTPIKAKALELGVPVFQPEKLSQPGVFEQLSELKPDIIVVVAFGQILRKNVLTLARLGCVNIHSSLLPRWRGAAPIQWAILAGDKESGISTMHLVEKLDAGDVLLQEVTPLSEDETVGTLHDRLSHIGLEAGTLKGRVQDESKVTYASKLTKEMESLSPEDAAETLERKIRALNPWPGTSVVIDGQRLKIKRATIRADLEGNQGKIYECFGMLLLGTSKGALQLLSVQWDGKKEVDAAAFMNGLKGKGWKLPLSLQAGAAQAQVPPR
jgi:methionyl-tRNA formyltransferase